MHSHLVPLFVSSAVLPIGTENCCLPRSLRDVMKIDKRNDECSGDVGGQRHSLSVLLTSCHDEGNSASNANGRIASLIIIVQRSFDSQNMLMCIFREKAEGFHSKHSAEISLF